MIALFLLAVRQIAQALPAPVPVAMDLSTDGQFLHVLLESAGHVATFRIEANGSLTSLRSASSVCLPEIFPS